jgi:hypothetical protein
MLLIISSFVSRSLSWIYGTLSDMCLVLQKKSLLLPPLLLPMLLWQLLKLKPMQIRCRPTCP